MLNQLLSQLGGSSTKGTVGVSVSPSVGLEMIEINPKTKTVEKYACKPLDYDYSKREIADYNAFIDVLKSLFEELKISPKSSVVLSLPSVHYGLIPLPINLSDEGVTSAIISEVEQSSYIFKRQDPVISWTDAYNNENKENREVVYGAIQQSALDEINAACVEVGCNLIAIETGPNCLLKTLSFNQLAEEQMAPNTTWIMMIIYQNSYSMMTMNGRSIMEYREEPLALRSFVGDEIYEAIISSAQLTLQTVISNYLYIVSETDVVSAEVLSMKIPFDGNVKFLESNKYVQNVIMQTSYNVLPNLAIKITPEVIGAGVYQASDFPFKFNLLGQGIDANSLVEDSAPKIMIGDIEFELTSAVLKKMLGLAAAVLIIPTVIIILLLNYLAGGQQSKLNEINSQIDTNKAELEGFADIDKKDEFDVKFETNTIQAYNRVKMIYYSAIGANIPPNTWLIYLKIFANNKVDIIGRAQTADAVYAFYKGMKMSVINSDLRLNRLEMSADSVGNLVIEDLNSIKPKFYEFEITNLNDDDLHKLDEELNAVPRDDEGNPIDSAENMPKKRRGFLFSDFLQLPNQEGKSTQSEEGNNSEQQSQGKPPKKLPVNLESIDKF